MEQIIFHPLTLSAVATAIIVGFAIGRLTARKPPVLNPMDQQLLTKMLEARRGLSGEQLRDRLIELVKAHETLC